MLAPCCYDAVCTVFGGCLVRPVALVMHNRDLLLLTATNPTSERHEAGALAKMSELPLRGPAIRRNRATSTAPPGNF